jgi:sterol desaturase/sphingolipid hydroxylase (fatty acid hydroxylase superfamily)
VLKSVHGIPLPVYPPGIDLPREARTARRRFYPVTILYTAYAVVVVGLGLRARPGTALGWLALGVAVWTWLEYMVHRHVLHGRFPDGPGWLRHRMHRFFDTMHGDHHLRPWDGMYINGFLDSLPFAVALALLSFLAPLPTAPVMVAGLLECYVAEEWVHYTVHFHRFRWRYFDYIRRHHLYHHSPRGGDIAFGLTSGTWDAVLGTRIPATDRRLLYARGKGEWRTSPAPSIRPGPG